MRLHSEIGPESFETSRKLKKLILNGEICLAGNKNLKIYGLLSCKSGRRMKLKNRVFFESESEAIENGYRPCGHCMRDEYSKWKIKLS
ncbi:Ada metal-binding domain-containing protein [Dyadobacter sp. CY323]|uniref:Ada metal-binding domain-containing protein n=1 Tax=Dyadobacter sp. CY323 TaxID=2907302 RepID=UPI00210617EE|nr:Ada metal-binding domain-containing protein [Dyadobacter sp. CY323]